MTSNSKVPYRLSQAWLDRRGQEDKAHAKAFAAAQPFPHAVIDDFLARPHCEFLSSHFPEPHHEVWLDWRTRHPGQYGKQGPGDSSRFDLLEDEFRWALEEFNSAPFLQYLETLTGIDDLVPDPFFTGGGMHQILSGGILDVHTDFNYYSRLKLYRRLNLLVYLCEDWQEGYGGELELWTDAPKRGGLCARRLAPRFNRCVVFQTDKRSFHGHPREWRAPEPVTRRSLAFYYYTKEPRAGDLYNEITDFQGVAEKPLPSVD